MKKGLLFGALALLLILVVCNSFYTVREDQFACVFRFSEIVGITDTPGAHFKLPFVDRVQYYSSAIQFYDIPPSEVLTSDKQNMTVDCYLTWRISDPQQFYRALGTVGKAEDRLDSITYSALKRAMGKLAQADIINMEDGALRNEIYDGITATVNESAADYGIEIMDVKIKRFDLPDSNLNAVYLRMISERNQMAEKYTADGNKEASLIRNEVDKTVNITVSNAEAEAAKLEAEGEAEYMRMLAQAYDSQDKKDFYEFILALDALKSGLTGEEKTVILSADSALAQILMGSFSK